MLIKLVLDIPRTHAHAYRRKHCLWLSPIKTIRYGFGCAKDATTSSNAYAMMEHSTEEQKREKLRLPIFSPDHVLRGCYCCGDPITVCQTRTHKHARARRTSLVAVTNRGSLEAWLLLYRGCLAFGGHGGTSESTASRNNQQFGVSICLLYTSPSPRDRG